MKVKTGFKKDGRIDAMQLIQIDSLDPESFQTLLHTLGEIFRAAVRHPLSASRPR